MTDPEEATRGEDRVICPLCGGGISGNLGSHIRDAHGDEALRKAILGAKEQGVSDAQIGDRYGISFNTLQQIMTEAYGANVTVLKRAKRIKRWEPPNFREETTTVWSFRQRGDWATHNGRYRGNWSPYIPRNIILKYSDPGDLVLDYFVGGGTTAVEAKLLGRRCIARDINRGAVGITRENLNFSLPRQLFGTGALPTFEPEVSLGDATDLSDIPDDSVDLICAHPPYAGIIKYSANIPGDLSDLSLQDFLAQMGQVARESLRVLKPGGKCAILIGDARQSKHVVPIGFQTTRVYLDAGFRLKELVIKRQHKCKTTGFWYKRSIEHNFLLLAHEHLPIFEKPTGKGVLDELSPGNRSLPHARTVEKIDRVGAINGREVETTSVWILPPEDLHAEMRRNLVTRFGSPHSQFVEIAVGDGQSEELINVTSNPSVIYLSCPAKVTDEQTLGDYRATVRRIAEEAAEVLPAEGFLVLHTRDVRIDGSLRPMALMLYEDLRERRQFAIKEIVVVVPQIVPELAQPDGQHLHITHQYLLVYRRRATDRSRG
ncbi:MAG: DNA methyltransferase [Promethearchaeota archaeon]